MEEACVTRVKAYAKVNLSLAVRGKNALRHVLDFVGTRLNLYDEVEVSARRDKDVTICYVDGRSYPADNAVRAAIWMMNEFSTNGVDIHIKKSIPQGAGFGGSTADGVGVIKAMQTLFGIDKLSPQKLLTLGSDFPYMYIGGTARVGGEGEGVEPMENPPKIKGIAAVEKDLFLSTKSVFQTYDEMQASTGDMDSFIASGFVRPFNDLEAPAIKLCPKIRYLGNSIRDIGFPNCVMTGSGTGYIGYFTEGDDGYNDFEKYLLIAKERLGAEQVFSIE